jgi:stage II sporulation protein D
MKKSTCTFLLPVLLIVVALRCVPYVQRPRKDNMVRVALVSGADNATITGIHHKKLYNCYIVSPDDVMTSSMIFSEYKGLVEVNGASYHGALEVKQINGKLWVINMLDMEAYLKGVVPCEIGWISEELIEAAKAQAVAARTYAYAHMHQYAELGFDLYATIRDQVYKGMRAERQLTNQAVKETEAKVLTYQGLPIEAKYHSTCGGRTADFNDAWPGTPPPYLRSVVCPYCTKSPHYTWKKALPKPEFFTRLRSQLTKIGISIPATELIKNVVLLRNARSKRVLRLNIITEENEYIVPGYHIRTVFGDAHDPGGLLKSNYITLVSTEDSVIIEGRGFGHGVGMCQFGALEMARQGKNYKDILTHYYSGVRISTIR